MEGFSPEVMAWIRGMGPNPFSLDGIGYQTPIMPSDDPDEMGTLKYQNAALTMLGKANNEYSDMAQIAQLGATTGGFSPDQFEPFATFEPVKAPGYMTLNYYKASSDPIMSYVAKRFEQKATALQIENEVRTLMNGDTPTGQAMAAAMPLTVDEMGNEAPDWKRVGGQIATLEQNILNDPQFNALDPTTGLPANVKYDETEAAKYFRERGLPNPYETYDPDLLASRDQMSREGMNREKMAESDIEFDVAKRALAAAAARANPENNARQRGMTLDGQPIGGRGGRSPSTADAAIERATFEQGTPLMFTAGDEFDAPPRPRSSGAGQRSTPTTTGSLGRMDSLRSHLGANEAAQETRRRSYVEAILARKENDKQRARATQDRTSQIDRQRMMAMLTKQGYTPFNDVNRARQASVYGA